MQTTPYAWPYDHDPSRPLTVERLAVVVCGWQAHWVPPTTTGEKIDEVRGIIEELSCLGATVLWVRSGAPGVVAHRPPVLPAVDSPEWELLEGPVPGDIVIDTPGVDAFLVEWTDLELRGRGLDRLVMCGIGTEGPVSSTTRSANDRGYECLTASDAVIHHDAVTGAASLSSVCMSGGIFGAVGAAADLVAELSTISTPQSKDPTS